MITFVSIRSMIFYCIDITIRKVKATCLINKF